ncbi:hypothetical protein [Solirubrobacter deserti]|uniref:LPXTG cell wall anchor domain-containing protein n=1 Tax=Solirubrobacter deserti TaxID=2282478 RepID=A0ABT4RJP6_9ACTN|nr:hypothetical protein [Solirubrobacter deserti]MDA0138688.1 hypothetical protein [Solirubrobacter deserti]
MAGGWLQRRKPAPSRKTKAVGALKRGMPGTKGAAALGVALAGVAGAVLRKRKSSNESAPTAAPGSTVPPTPPTAVTNAQSTPPAPVTDPHSSPSSGKPAL